LRRDNFRTGLTGSPPYPNAWPLQPMRNWTRKPRMSRSISTPKMGINI